ncbi:hypothetical protein EUTSA_v10015793mg [Eutrema salsugineum]|uniref:RRM domain-containing protein n=1 Tax=Eutrema salsugineum TaxID=72664 RepID=V4LC73_EUTSA|nr:uncharacterized protein LOC18018177 [Eutrema salsugineum]ESQ41309.1 hypothetical protein EUTSA_v10015793mg [Eutrema salsugineum]
MASSSSTSSKFVTREEFHAFHKLDRALFSRLVLSLRRDISQSLQVMSFLLHLEKTGLLRNIIVNLVYLPDFFINAVAEEAVLCLSCLSYEDFSTFVATLGQNTNSFTIPLITRMTGEYLSLAVIHKNRENILLEMKKHLTRICYPAFEDICVHAEKEKMYTVEREKAIEKMSQLGISRIVSKAGQKETSNHVAGTNKVSGAFSDDEQVNADERTVFLTFSRGYPISEAEVHAFFTRRFGEIIESIHMPGVEGNGQALYAKMVLHSASKIPEIVENGGDTKTKFTINGKHVWARKFLPQSSNSLPQSSNSLPQSCGVSL